jgi:hypothetical protein
MKTFALLGLLLTTSAMAAPSHQVIETQATVDLHDLACVIPAGQPDAYTLLKSTHSLFLGTQPNGVLDFKHVRASANGCDKPVLDDLNKTAMQFFGFLHGVKVTVTKDLSASFVNGNGQCVATQNEKVEIALAPGVVLSDEQGILKAATDCN